jgi:hypothetical protein
MRPDRYNLYRFVAVTDDPCPAILPPAGPYWITDYDNDGDPIIFAYLPPEADITDYWPEAVGVEVIEENTEIVFTERFSRPTWWK